MGDACAVNATLHHVRWLPKRPDSMLAEVQPPNQPDRNPARLVLEAGVRRDHFGKLNWKKVSMPDASDRGSRSQSKSQRSKSQGSRSKKWIANKQIASK